MFMILLYFSYREEFIEILHAQGAVPNDRRQRVTGAFSRDKPNSMS